MSHKNKKRHQRSRIDQAFLRAHRIDAASEQHNRCEYCRIPFIYRPATADHIVAQKHSGTDERNNIIASCEPCNQTKGDMPIMLFRRKIEQPKYGEPIRFLIIWSARRMNLRIERMQSILARATGGSIDG